MAPWTPWMRLWLIVYHLLFVPLLLQMCIFLFVFFSFFVIFNQYVSHLLEVRCFAWMPSLILEGRRSWIRHLNLAFCLCHYPNSSSGIIISFCQRQKSLLRDPLLPFFLAWNNFVAFSLFEIHNTKCYCWNKLIVKSSIKFFQFVLVSYILLGLLYLLNHNLSWMKIFTIPWKTKFRFQTKATQKMLFEYI